MSIHDDTSPLLLRVASRSFVSYMIMSERGPELAVVRSKHATRRSVVYKALFIPLTLGFVVPLVVEIVAGRAGDYGTLRAYMVAMMVGSALAATIDCIWLLAIAFSCHENIADFFCCPWCAKSMTTAAADEELQSLEQAWDVSGWQRARLPSAPRIYYIAAFTHGLCIALACVLTAFILIWTVPFPTAPPPPPQPGVALLA
jgi:hypothetical protein